MVVAKAAAVAIEHVTDMHPPGLRLLGAAGRKGQIPPQGRRTGIEAPQQRWIVAKAQAAVGPLVAKLAQGLAAVALAGLTAHNP